jgi:heat shock protein HtpX
VSSDIARIPTRDLRTAEPLNAFYFAPALSVTRGQVTLSTIFSTHPSLEKRLAALDKISRQLSK